MKTEPKLIAFHGDKKLKTAMLRELTWHAVQDKIVKGTYGDTRNNRDFRGCAIGCAVHSLARIQKRHLNTSDHFLLQSELGIPAEIAFLMDGIFEMLPHDDAMLWPRRVIASIRPGADLAMVIPQFLLWVLADPETGSIVYSEAPETKRFIEAVIAVFEEWVKSGQRPNDDSHLGKVAWDARAAARAARAKFSADKLIELLENA